MAVALIPLEQLKKDRVEITAVKVTDCGDGSCGCGCEPGVAKK